MILMIFMIAPMIMMISYGLQRLVNSEREKICASVNIGERPALEAMEGEILGNAAKTDKTEKFLAPRPTKYNHGPG